MEQFMKTLLALSLAGTVLALILMLLDRSLGKRISSRMIYLAWLLVLLRFILPVPGLLSVPTAAPFTYTATAIRPASDAAEAPSRSYRDGTNPGPSGVVAAEPQSVYDATEPTGRGADDEEETPLPVEAERAAFPIWTLMFWIWAVGAFCVAGWNLSGFFCYRRVLYRTLRPAKEQEAIHLHTLHPRPWPALFRSGAVTTPLLLGLLRPVIVLPDRAYTPEMLDGILRHELTHYRRGDLAVKWFATAVFCVHWYNPFVYLFRRELDRTCELSCDAHLLRDMDANEKQCYGELLLTLAADRTLPHRVVAMSFTTEKRNLKERLIQIMTFKKKGWAAFAVMLLALAMLVGCAAAMGPATIPDAQEEELSNEEAATGNRIDAFDDAVTDDTTDESQTPSEEPQEPDHMMYKEAVLNQHPEADKVCIRVEPSVLRDKQFYYYIPADEAQEWLMEQLKALDLEGEPFDRRWEGKKETGWQILYNDIELMVFEGGYLYYTYDDGENGSMECLIEEPELCDYIQSMLQEELDYTPFDVTKIHGILSAKLEVCSLSTNREAYSQTITDAATLLNFSNWFSNAKYIYGGVGCLNERACLELSLESGETVRLSMSTDSCSNFGINGVYYDYRPTDDWDNREFFECFDEIPWQWD